MDPPVSNGHVFGPTVDHGFWLVPMVFQGSFMIFHGFWLVSMVFQGSFIVFHGFWLVSMVFQGSFIVFHGFWWVSMVLLVENITKLYLGPTIQSSRLWPSYVKI